jgi:hypothetical protein
MSLNRAFTIFSSRTGILQLFLRASENTWQHLVKSLT